MNKWFFLLILSSVMVINGCSSQNQQLPPMETYEISDFGFSIDYPSGWFATTHNWEITVIAQNEEDFKTWNNPETPKNGIFIVLDHRKLTWLQTNLGLPENASIDDLFQLNIYEISFMIYFYCI